MFHVRSSFISTMENIKASVSSIYRVDTESIKSNIYRVDTESIKCNDNDILHLHFKVFYTINMHQFE